MCKLSWWLLWVYWAKLNKYKTGEIYGDDFPFISFKDIEISQKLLLDDLGVVSLEAVIGPSIGGLMALEFSLLYPDYVKNLISISSGYRLSTIQLLHNLEQAYILDLAKSSNGREAEYLSLARMIAIKPIFHLSYYQVEQKMKVSTIKTFLRDFYLLLKSLT
ncbi:MAG: hypothetical protein Ct9H90mP10_08040 [Actinomycetota bacterium]|nr:MAG: hypothetical protein Ct9H90mP10_08040 [Actinomycetota bacterium]